jgi:hypothetical protein
MKKCLNTLCRTGRTRPPSSPHVILLTLSDSEILSCPCSLRQGNDGKAYLAFRPTRLVSSRLVTVPSRTLELARDRRFLRVEVPTRNPIPCAARLVDGKGVAFDLFEEQAFSPSEEHGILFSELVRPDITIYLLTGRSEIPRTCKVERHTDDAATILKFFVEENVTAHSIRFPIAATLALEKAFVRSLEKVGSPNVVVQTWPAVRLQPDRETTLALVRGTIGGTIFKDKAEYLLKLSDEAD